MGDSPARSGVLVAVDGSETSLKALRWAVREAQSRGTALTIAHCYYWPSSGLGAMDAIGFLMEGLAKDSRDVLDVAKTAANELAPDVDVTVQSHLGAPVATLVELSKRYAVTVLGSRGLGGFKGMLLGSVSTGLVANALSSVVVVRGDEALDAPGSDAPIVVGVDPSDAGKAALAEAFALADRRHCPLVAVHATQVAGRIGPEQERAWQESVAADLDAQIAPMAAEHPAVAVEPVIYRDRATAALLARAQTARLVVVGTRGRSEMKGVLLGSTSRALVQHAPCPVMVVR